MKKFAFLGLTAALVLGALATTGPASAANLGHQRGVTVQGQKMKTAIAMSVTDKAPGLASYLDITADNAPVLTIAYRDTNRLDTVALRDVGRYNASAIGDTLLAKTNTAGQNETLLASIKMNAGQQGFSPQSAQSIVISTV